VEKVLKTERRPTETFGALCTLSCDHTSGGSAGKIFPVPFLKKWNFFTLLSYAEALAKF
jgi:hypothetical protein